MPEGDTLILTMAKVVKKAIPVLLLLPFVFSCITIEEEIWLKADGSGSAVIKFLMPVHLFQNEGVRRHLARQIPLTPDAVKKKFEQMNGIEVKKVDEYFTRQKLRVLEVHLDFRHISNLSDSSVTYALLHQGKYSQLLIKVKRQKKEGAKSQTPRGRQIDEIVRNSLKRYQIRFTIHFPTPISGTVRLQKKGKRDATWHIPFNEIYTSGPPIVGKVIYFKEPSLWDRIVNFFRYP